MTQHPAAETFTVGQAARAAGVSAKAVRLYETKGLLPAAERSDAGYRLYTGSDVATLHFIRQARTLGLHLDEIGYIIAIRDGGSTPCQHVLRLLDQHISDIDRTITQLRQLRDTLKRTRSQAATNTNSTVCRIIEHAAP